MVLPICPPAGLVEEWPRQLMVLPVYRPDGLVKVWSHQLMVLPIYRPIGLVGEAEPVGGVTDMPPCRAR